VIDIKEIRRMDRVSDALFEGQRLRALPVADNETRESDPMPGEGGRSRRVGIGTVHYV